MYTSMGVAIFFLNVSCCHWSLKKPCKNLHWVHAWIYTTTWPTVQHAQKCKSSRNVYNFSIFCVLHGGCGSHLKCGKALKVRNLVRFHLPWRFETRHQIHGNHHNWGIKQPGRCITPIHQLYFARGDESYQSKIGNFDSLSLGSWQKARSQKQMSIRINFHALFLFAGKRSFGP